MTQEHLAALLGVAGAKKDEQGFQRPSEERTLTLYVASNGASLSVTKIEALRQDGDVLQARTTRGELFVIALVDVYAGAVDSTGPGKRKAGFV